MGGFFLSVKLHREGPAPVASAASLCGAYLPDHALDLEDFNPLHKENFEDYDSRKARTLRTVWTARIIRAGRAVRTSRTLRTVRI